MGDHERPLSRKALLAAVGGAKPLATAKARNRMASSIRIWFTEALIEVSDEARHFLRELAKAVSISAHPLLKFAMSKKMDELRVAAIRLMLDSDGFALLAE